MVESKDLELMELKAQMQMLMSSLTAPPTGLSAVASVSLDHQADPLVPPRALCSTTRRRPAFFSGTSGRGG